MRIAHFLLGRSNPESSNGVDKTVFFLSKAQAELGHDVSVLSISDLPPIPVPGVTVGTFAPRRLPSLRPFDKEGRARPRNPFRLPDGMWDDMVGRHPHIVHFHSVHIPEALWLADRLRRSEIPYCVSPHGGLLTTAQRHRRRLRKQLFSTLLERRYLRRASLIHAVSQAEAEELRRQNLGPPVVVAHNCIDASAVPDDVDPGPVIERFPQLQGKRVLGYLGRLDTGPKGLDLLLRGWARIADPSNEVLLLVGPDWRGGRMRLERLASGLGVNGGVVFAPAVSGREKWAYFAAMDVFVAPSRWEAAPFTVLEAMATRTAVVATPASDPDGLIRASEAGWVVQAEVEALARALKTVTQTSGEQLRLMGTKARRLIEREYRWNDAAEILTEAYEDATRG
ncbi:MAG TPA: glycosyltransferase family 4 protein [Actinomycetota bacterium]